MADIVPVDLCINMVVCLGLKASGQGKGSEPLVYNFTSGGTNPITWSQVIEKVTASIMRTPYEGMLWYPGGSPKENIYHHRFYEVSDQTLEL